MRKRVLLLLPAVLGALLGARVARCDDAPPRWPPAAEQRYEQGRQLMQHGRYTAASDVYQSVADWPDGGAFPERARALFLAGLMQENARNYDRAIAIYREVVRRFPGDAFATRAADAAKVLDSGDHARGIDFRSRYDAAWDELSPARDIAEREGVAAGKARLEHAIGLLEGILRDHRDHPQARDVAIAIGDANMTLKRYAAACQGYREALALAREDVARSGHAAASAVRGAEEKLGEATRFLWRARVDRSAQAMLVLVGLALVWARPWRQPDPGLVRLGGVMILVTLVLAAVAGGIAVALRDYVDDHSPLLSSAAALLVALPSVTGEIAALGAVNGLQRRGMRGSLVLAATLGVVAALAVATRLVYAYDLFPLLDSEF
jgi:tetratricopeptide (TPR) repeat protein